ncbi:MAG: tRNA preQ1(34) S-adenosylmethionine ribosyltransferase-isomerase QueA [Candidatus Nomurabacteria bacterium]|jgi:S-adenosylmethionine:tRNA ribosyltransferase-isomerase|nr:tRNA preQ1(34) S-adenosylmethionine ribosyltransferase-isomerase QueA [Candidatus Nomurabacteria bacterium]
MKVSDFDYDLPDELIAKHPPRVRGASGLLVLNRTNGEMMDSRYVDLAEFLRAGDVLVLNDTRVIKARLMTKRADGAAREILILERHGASDDWHRHRVMYRGRLTAGDILFAGESEIVVEEILGDGLAIVHSATDLLELAEKYGSPPLPPYLHREATGDDIERYQTVFAEQAGSVAAPTASLNMTAELLSSIRARGVRIVYLTLHVGLGTFLPMRSETVEGHQIHSEYFEIPPATVEAVKSAQRVVAVGTTVARTLEYFAQTGKQSGEADIFIYPGYEFQIVDALLTNFHAPRSTVLMLATAFAGVSNLRAAYAHAIAQKYRFLSYGDSMFIS